MVYGPKQVTVICYTFHRPGLDNGATLISKPCHQAFAAGRSPRIREPIRTSGKD